MNMLLVSLISHMTALLVRNDYIASKRKLGFLFRAPALRSSVSLPPALSESISNPEAGLSGVIILLPYRQRVTSLTVTVLILSTTVNTGYTLHGSWCCWLHGLSGVGGFHQRSSYNADKYSRLREQGRHREWTPYGLIIAAMQLLLSLLWLQSC